MRSAALGWNRELGLETATTATSPRNGNGASYLFQSGPSSYRQEKKWSSPRIETPMSG